MSMTVEGPTTVEKAILLLQALQAERGGEETVIIVINRP